MASSATSDLLTDQQRAAITTRGVSIALSAGAGCGKTLVLTERFLAHLEPQAGGPSVEERLSRLVAITFTDAAAREMRNRIRSTCRQRLLDREDTHAESHWLALWRQLEMARVSTIHSFCGSLLRAHAVEAGLDPRFAILEPNQASTLLAELIDEELRKQLSARHEPLVDLLVDYGLNAVRTMVQILLRERHAIHFEAWLTRKPEEIVARWQTYQQDVVWPLALRHVCQSAEAKRLLQILEDSIPTNATMLARTRELKIKLPVLEDARNPQQALEELREHARVQNGGGAKAWPSPEIYALFRDTAEALRKKVDRAAGTVEFDAESALPAAVAGLHLLAVAQPIVEKYEARKRELGFLDFDDLLIRARNLLVDPAHGALRERLAAHLDLLLVDEFQDTDPLQVELIKALCGAKWADGKLFFVGDYKQSIYRFRGADPRVFRNLRDEIPPQGQLPLARNFRSQPAILEFVNALFETELGPEYEPLVAEYEQKSPTPAIEFLWASADPGAAGPGADQAGSDNPQDMAAQRQREATWIARRLRAMIDGGERIIYAPKDGTSDENGLRPMRPGDVAILFRALSDVQYYEQALRECGLEYYVVGGHAFYSQQEVFDLLNLLRAVASPADTVSLLGVLRSPFFSLADETLFWLAKHEEGLAASLSAEPRPEIGAEERSRVRFAAETLAHLRQWRDRVPIATLLQEALARTGYDAVLLAEFLGERKLANLNKLLDQARAMDRAGIFTLQDFIAQLSEFVAQRPDEALAATHAATANVVRLMSVHRSKGLEFPVVVVPDLDRKSHGSTVAAAFHPELGPLVRNPEKTGVCGLDLFMRTEAAEDEAETARLLYVATTRAASYLMLSSAVKDLASPRGPWSKLLAERFDLETGAPLVPLPQECEELNVRVTRTEPPAPRSVESSGRQHLRMELLAEARDLAKRGGGNVPVSVASIPADRSARSHYSFSRLSGELHRRPVQEDAEQDEQAETTPPKLLDARCLGTLVHEVLEAWNWQSPGDVAAEVNRRAPKHLLDSALERSAAIDLVKRFVASQQAEELKRARQLHREVEFLLAWPPEAGSASGRCLEGVIDCLYQDQAGSWHILDYKTNQVAKSGLQELAAKYEMQMLIYAWAAEQAIGQAPASMVLYFLRPDLASTFTWDEDARRRARQLVDQAIAADLAAGALGPIPEWSGTSSFCDALGANVPAPGR